MKLSKNRLNKIKAKKNASRKKFHLRKKESKYNKSQKKHRRNTHLKQKTMKIYVGGGYGDQFIKPICIGDMVNKLTSCVVGTSDYNNLRPKLVADLKDLEEKKKKLYEAEYTLTGNTTSPIKYGSEVLITAYNLSNIARENGAKGIENSQLYFKVTNFKTGEKVFDLTRVIPKLGEYYSTNKDNDPKQIEKQKEEIKEKVENINKDYANILKYPLSIYTSEDYQNIINYIDQEASIIKKNKGQTNDVFNKSPIGTIYTTIKSDLEKKMNATKKEEEAKKADATKKEEEEAKKVTLPTSAPVAVPPTPSAPVNGVNDNSSQKSSDSINSTDTGLGDTQPSVLDEKDDGSVASSDNISDATTVNRNINGNINGNITDDPTARDSIKTDISDITDDGNSVKDNESMKLSSDIPEKVPISQPLKDDNSEQKLAKDLSNYYKDKNSMMNISIPEIKRGNEIEEQVATNCGVHALNNLFGTKWIVSEKDDSYDSESKQNSMKIQGPESVYADLVNKWNNTKTGDKPYGDRNMFSICKIESIFGKDKTSDLNKIEGADVNDTQRKAIEEDKDRKCDPNGNYLIADIMIALNLSGYTTEEVNDPTNVNLPELIMNTLNQDENKDSIGMILNTGNGGHYIAIRRNDGTSDKKYKIVDSIGKNNLDFTTVDEMKSFINGEAGSATNPSRKYTITRGGILHVKKFTGKSIIQAGTPNIGQKTIYVSSDGRSLLNVGRFLGQPYLEDITKLLCESNPPIKMDDVRLETVMMKKYNEWSNVIEKMDPKERADARISTERPENKELAKTFQENNVISVTLEDIEGSDNKEPKYIEISSQQLISIVNQVRGVTPSRIDKLKEGVGSIGKSVGHGLSSTYSGMKSMGSYLKGVATSSGSADKDTNSLNDEDKGNIILKINETVDNGMKRVNIDILVPREGSDVIVRDWSKDTSLDALGNLSSHGISLNKSNDESNDESNDNSDDNSVSTSDAVADSVAGSDDNTINTISTNGTSDSTNSNINN